MNGHPFDGVAKARREDRAYRAVRGQPEGLLPDGALNGVVGGANGRQLYGVWGPDGTFLGYVHGGRPF